MSVVRLHVLMPVKTLVLEIHLYVASRRPLLAY